MQFLCCGYTSGGPIAIVQQPNLSFWDADDDYLRITKEPKHGSIQCVKGLKKKCCMYFLYQESDGNFHVYFDRMNFAVLSEIFAEEGHELWRGLPPIELAVLEKMPITVNDFGGTVAIFDATIPGSAIDLTSPGCGQSRFGVKSMPSRHDMALIEVDTGDWQAIELFFESNYVSFSGVWFRKAN